jgi:hypothetical protein
MKNTTGKQSVNTIEGMKSMLKKYTASILSFKEHSNEKKSKLKLLCNF